MRDLNHDLKELCRRNRDGSYATQADRAHILDLVANQLHEMGFRGLSVHGLKPRHVEKLVERWLAEKLSPGTIKNRMCRFDGWRRRSARTTSSSAPMPPTASRIGCTSPTSPKQRSLSWTSYNIRTPCTRMSLRLQAAFGLRREDSIKIVPAWADRGDTLVLKDSWTKGGRELQIPIRTLEQRQLVDEAKALVKGKSLVAPGYTTYRDYLQHFRDECARVGIHAFHGHRHFYAQTRYQELTGQECPARGGPTSSSSRRSRRPSIARRGRSSAARWATAASRLRRCISGGDMSTPIA